MKGRAVFIAIALAVSSFAIVATGATGITPAGADTVSTDFESYSNGSVYGQGGWTGTPNACGTVDEAVVDTSGFPGAPPEFGTKAWRVSNSVFGGCFAQPKSPSLANQAGEMSAASGGQSGGHRQSTYEAEFTVASATGAYQHNLQLVVNPDRGDGARMSYLGVRHVDGANLTFLFYDVQGGETPSFVPTEIPGTFDPTVPHTVKIAMEFVEGPSNDIVEIFVDGNLVHTGTSWEDYYRFSGESNNNGADPQPWPTRTVDSLLFRPGSPAEATVAGNGFLIDNLNASTPDPAASHTDVTVTPGALNGWGFLQESPTALETGTFVTGPDTPPAGVGSVQLAVTASEGHIVATQAYDGTRLDEISVLEYSTYQPGPTLAATLQFGIKYRPTDTAFGGRLVFEPYQTVGTVGAGWQTWSPLTGKWWGSNTSANGTGLGASGECSQNFPCTWSRVLELFPNAEIGNGGNPTDGPLLFKVGALGSWPGFTGNVDKLTIGVGGGPATTTYDFEPGCTTTCYVDSGVVTSGDGHPATPFKTIQEGVDGVAVDGEVVVAAGTYDEHVTIDKSLTLTGAGETTVIDPSTDGPAITVTSGGTSETDRLVLNSLKTTGAGGGRPNGQGIKLAVPTAAGHITLMNVTSTGNSGDGLLQNGAGALEDIVVESSSFSGNAYGGYAVTAGAGEITKFRVDNSHFDDNGTWGWSVFIKNNPGVGPYVPTLTDVVVEDSSFDGNGHKGIYLERLDDALLQRLSVVGSGDGASLPEAGFTAHAAGIDINLKYREFSDIELLDSTITGSGGGDATNGGALLFKQRDDAPSYGPPAQPAATVDDVTISGNVISNNPVTGVRFGEPGKTNAGPTDTHVNHNTISNNTGIGFNAENTSAAIDGECNFYGTEDGPSGEGAGTGDDVSVNVDFTPWKIAEDSPCPPNVPGAPTGALGTGGDEQALVSFVPPVDNGGSLVTEYTATCVSEDPDTERSGSGTVSPVTVGDLENGTLYVCWVHATNFAGDGPNSNFAFATPGTSPDAPTDVSVVRTGSDAEVSFTPPLDDGGFPITEYTATCIGPDTKTSTGAGSPMVVSGLATDADYTCTVRATNARGDGDESDGFITAAADGTLAGSVHDLVPPKGTGAAFDATANVGVLICEAGGAPGCAEPQQEQAVADGTFTKLLEEGDYEVAPYYCKSSRPSCAPDSSGIRVGPTWTPVTVEAGLTTDPAVALNVGFRPDVQARRGDGTAFRGSNTYAATGSTAPSISAGVIGSRTFVVRIDNDGDLRESINLRAAKLIGSRFNVTYRVNGAKLQRIGTTTGRDFALDPGDQRTVTVTITPKAGALPGNQAVVQLRALSKGQAGGAKADFVKVRVTKI